MKILPAPEVATAGKTADEYVAAKSVADAHQVAANETDNLSGEIARLMKVVRDAIYNNGPEFAQKVADSIGHERFLGLCYVTAEDNWTRAQRGEDPVAVFPTSMVLKVNGVPVDWAVLFTAWGAAKAAFIPAGAVVSIVAAE